MQADQVHVPNAPNRNFLNLRGTPLRFLGFSLIAGAALCFWALYPDLLQLCYTLVSFAFFGTLALYYRYLRDQPLLCALGWLSATIQCIFLLQQQPQNYTYDIYSHLDTIRYYGRYFNFAFQPITLGSEAHQPPLYYLVTGLIFSAAFHLQQMDKVLLSIASLNYFCFSLFLLYGIASLRYTLTSPFLIWLGIIALLAWPANLLHSFRIGNDIPLYLAFAGSSYHFMRWYKEERTGELRYTLLWVAFGCAIKNSALLLPMIFGLLLAGKYCHGRNMLHWPGQLWAALRPIPLKPLRTALLLLALALSLGLGRNVYNAFSYGNTTIFEGKSGATSNFHFTPALIEFDPEALMAYPYVYDIFGRDDLFWNIFIRSLSFGEYRWNGFDHAHVLNFLMMCLWTYFISATLARTYVQKKPLGWTGFYAVHIGLSLIGMAWVRMYFNGFVPWADARHMYPVIIFFLIGYLSLLEQFQSTHTMLYRLGVVLLAGYAMVSLVHIALQLSFDNILPMLKNGYRAPLEFK